MRKSLRGYVGVVGGMGGAGLHASGDSERERETLSSCGLGHERLALMCCAAVIPGRDQRQGWLSVQTEGSWVTRTVVTWRLIRIHLQILLSLDLLLVEAK